MYKKSQKYILTFLIVSILFGGIFVVAKTLIKKKNTRFDIANFSSEKIDEYFGKISEAQTNEEKDNMLIVISNSKIKNIYDAKDIIEAPNNQYILKFDSEEDKNTALEKLKNDKKIDSVEENGYYTFEEGNYNSWGIEKMALDSAIDYSNTQIENMNQVTVAIIDGGCDIDLFNKYYGGKISEYYNVLEQSTTEMSDEYGHGTHIAGTIAEGTPDNVKILPIKVSKTRNIYYTDVIAAINYIVYNKKAQVINMSFGGYGNNEALEQAIEMAKENNIISVAAAGNDNTSRTHYPSSFENTISIGSVDSNLNKSHFSNYGSGIDFVAPGTDIRSILGKNATISKENGNNDDDDHEIISGTSMATPHVAAAVAILKGYNLDLTYENIVNILKDKARDLGDTGWDEYYGNGFISFENAQFCDGTYCDEYGVFKDLNKIITDFEITEVVFTKYNYYSLTNLMGSKVKVTYNDNSSEEILLSNIPNVEIINYDPISLNEQTITIKYNDISKNIQITNPNNLESGWEYNVTSANKIEITGYKNHELEIGKLYVPETIESKEVISFVDNFKFSTSGNDIKSYTYLYLPSTFTRIGNYSLADTNIKYVMGDNTKIEVGAHAFENSKIVSVNVSIKQIEDYAFKDCYDLYSIKVWQKGYTDNDKINIGEYAFYNCKKLFKIELDENITYASALKIGEYAFYNCVSLVHFNLSPSATIGEYAFYNTSLLYDIELNNVESIGKYAFYGSGLKTVTTHITTINESTFENCKKLKTLYFSGTRIEKRAFWASGLENISMYTHADRTPLEYIAEDAFAYAPIKGTIGMSSEKIGNYEIVRNLGIVENDNKLLVGFTDYLFKGKEDLNNANITDNITEIGNYAFTGNSKLKNIVIPETVAKIGTHSFEDCDQLSNVYMLSKNILFDDNTFKRNNESEVQEDLKIYVYKDSQAKEFVKEKNLNYRHIEPDEIIVSNYKETYKAFDSVDFLNLKVSLIYHEEEEREEVLENMYYNLWTPLLNIGIGFLVNNQNNNSRFQYGDTYFIVKAYNAMGYLTTKNIEVTVEKAIPKYTIPTDITAKDGQKLSEVELPENFEWMDKEQTITGIGEVVYKAKYIPTDTQNYEIVENIDIVVNVEKNKTIIIPELKVENKIYDGTTDIPISNIKISNLEDSEYTIISSLSSSTNVGKSKATIKVKLSDEKYKEYSFEDDQQEKDFIVDFEILKADINIIDNTKDVTIVFDGKPHSINVELSGEQSYIVKYMDNNEEYTLESPPSYIDVGTHVIQYKVYINDNYTEYYGQRKLTINESYSYKINKYKVDELNKYIDLIDINTTVEEFKNNIDLNVGYTLDVEYKSVNGKQLLYTGSKTKIYHNNVLFVEYTNIIRGDVNGNAVIDIIDYIRIMKDIMGTSKLTGVYMNAADVNQNGKIDIIDYIRIMKMIMEENS